MIRRVVDAVLDSRIVRELAMAERVCVRPLIRRVFDRDTDTETRVALACGSTREAVCPPCAQKARVLRMQQCAKGWHRTDEPPAPPRMMGTTRTRPTTTRRATRRWIGGCGRPGAGMTRRTCPASRGGPHRGPGVRDP